MGKKEMLTTGKHGRQTSRADLENFIGNYLFTALLWSPR